MQSSQTVECICQCTAARSLAGDPQSIQPENNITETIPLPWCLLTMTGWFSDTEASAVYEQCPHWFSDTEASAVYEQCTHWFSDTEASAVYEQYTHWFSDTEASAVYEQCPHWFSDTEASAVYEQYTHKRNSLFNKNSVNLLASQSATQLQIECGHQVILQPELTHTPVGTRSENLHQGGIVTPRCAIQTWGHRHIITVRRHHHRGSCCCFSLCHWCNWKYRVQSVTAENTQYNPSQLKIHSTIHHSWKYTIQSITAENTQYKLPQLKIHSTIHHS